MAPNWVVLCDVFGLACSCELAMKPVVDDEVDHEMDTACRTAVRDRVRIGQTQIPAFTGVEINWLAVEQEPDLTVGDDGDVDSCDTFDNIEVMIAMLEDA